MWHATSTVLACGHEHDANSEKPEPDTISCHVEWSTQPSSYTILANFFLIKKNPKTKLKFFWIISVAEKHTELSELP